MSVSMKLQLQQQKTRRWSGSSSRTAADPLCRVFGRGFVSGAYGAGQQTLWTLLSILSAVWLGFFCSDYLFQSFAPTVPERYILRDRDEETKKKERNGNSWSLKSFRDAAGSSVTRLPRLFDASSVILFLSLPPHVLDGTHTFRLITFSPVCERRMS